ncbi:MAG TPA: hypothetical protein VFZ54_18915 [Burkholderiales bacterium]
MLVVLFTPRSSTDPPRQIGPLARLRIEGNKIRGGESSGVVLAECSDRHWILDGKSFYRADCPGPVHVKLEGCEGIATRFGPFRHFSLSDGMAYVDRAVFARLNPSNKWYVERADAECPALLLAAAD